MRDNCPSYTQVHSSVFLSRKSRHKPVPFANPCGKRRNPRDRRPLIFGHFLKRLDVLYIQSNPSWRLLLVKGWVIMPAALGSILQYAAGLTHSDISDGNPPVPSLMHLIHTSLLYNLTAPVRVSYNPWSPTGSMYSSMSQTPSDASSDTFPSPPDMATLTSHQQFAVIGSWFLGPQSENRRILADSFDIIVDEVATGREKYFPADPVRSFTRTRTFVSFILTMTVAGPL
jgi:hypothetical protein